MDNTKAEKDHLETLWESNKDKVERDKESEFIVFNERELSDSGINKTDFRAPGNLSTRFTSGKEKRFFLREFGSGRFKLFRKL